MFKNFVVALVLGLLQFQQSLATKIDILANGQTMRYQGVSLEKGTARFNNKDERLPVGTMFRHRFAEGEAGYVYTPWQDIPLRMVEEYTEGAENKFQFKELKVQIFPVVGGQEVATGALLAWELRTWTLRFSYPVSKNPSEGVVPAEVSDEVTQKYLEELKTTFQQGRTFHPVADDFNLLEWDKLHGTVEGCEIGITRANKLVLIVRFATSRACNLQKNGTSKVFDVFHIAGLYDDTGRLVFNDIPLRDNFKRDNLIQYASKEEQKGDPRDIGISPLRVITTMEDGTNGLVYGKPMVTILYGTNKELEGRLFSADLDQTNIIVEVKFIMEIPKDFEENYIKIGSTYSIQPKTNGLKQKDSYKADKIVRFEGDKFSNKKAVRIHFGKAGKK